MDEYKYKIVRVDDGSFVIPFSSDFHLVYRKGSRVKAIKRSLGIMLFHTKQRAEDFAKQLLQGSKVHKFKIKRVIPIGKASVPAKIVARIASDRELKTFNRSKRAYFGGTLPPTGTVCYPEVIVVD